MIRKWLCEIPSPSMGWQECECVSEVTALIGVVVDRMEVPSL
jgi:hypothetical protein